MICIRQSIAIRDGYCYKWNLSLSGWSKWKGKFKFKKGSSEKVEWVSKGFLRFQLYWVKNSVWQYWWVSQWLAKSTHGSAWNSFHKNIQTFQGKKGVSIVACWVKCFHPQVPQELSASMYNVFLTLWLTSSLLGEPSLFVFSTRVLGKKWNSLTDCQWSVSPIWSNDLGNRVNSVFCVSSLWPLLKFGSGSLCYAHREKSLIVPAAASCLL